MPLVNARRFRIIYSLLPASILARSVGHLRARTWQFSSNSEGSDKAATVSNRCTKSQAMMSWHEKRHAIARRWLFINDRPHMCEQASSLARHLNTRQSHKSYLTTRTD